MPFFIYQLSLTPHFRNESSWTGETSAIVTAHFNHLKQNCEKGKVLLAGRSDLPVSDADNFGICIFEAESIKDARQFMNSDPAVNHGVMIAKLFPFSLAMLKGE